MRIARSPLPRLGSTSPKARGALTRLGSICFKWLKGRGATPVQFPSAQRDEELLEFNFDLSSGLFDIDTHCTATMVVLYWAFS